MESVQVDLPLLLPDVPDARDACVQRLTDLLAQRRGISRVHVVPGPETTSVCLHYDGDVISLDSVHQMARAAGAEVLDRYGHRTWSIRMFGAEDTGRNLEQALLRVDGVLAVSANFPGQVVRVEFERGRFDPAAVDDALRTAGADVAAAAAPGESTQESWYDRNRELAWSLASGVLLLAGFLLERRNTESALAIALYVGGYVFGAFDLVRHTAAGIRKGQFAFNIDLLMLMAALGAAVLGEWAEGAFLLFLFSLAHALEHYALGRARDSIRALADLAPSMANVERGGRIEQVPVAELKPGARVVVKPGERISVDGRIVNGRSAVNQAPITGESVPVDKDEGDDVFAGTVNGEGVLTIETVKAVGDRTLDRVIALVEQAQTQKAATQVFTDRFERVFVPCVLVGTLLVIVVPPLFGFREWSTSVYRGMALLVASSPCALALGTPATVLAGVAQAARRGVLIKGGMHLENLGTIRAIALDKTGTLTIGRPEVTDVVPAPSVEVGALLRVAAAVERVSQHPLAAAVVRYADANNVQLVPAEGVENVTGRGIRAMVEGGKVEIGNHRLFSDANVAVPPEVIETVTRLQQTGRSVMIARQDQRWLGVLGLADRPREGVRAVLDRLRQVGLQRIVMLTGDHQAVGEAIGKEVGIDEVMGGLLPEDKVTAMQALLDTHDRVAMVGDGVNDAPALAVATVGIAMGAAGTATALETADVALMADDLGRLPFAIGLSRKARGIIRQNLYLSLAVIAVLIVATTTGVFGIGPAVLVHEGSTLLVIGNALRLLTYEG